MSRNGIFSRTSTVKPLKPLHTLAGFRFTGGFGFVVLGVLELASLSLEELSVEDSELVLSTLDEVVPSLIWSAMMPAMMPALHSVSVWGKCRLLGAKKHFSQHSIEVPSNNLSNSFSDVAGGAIFASEGNHFATAENSACQGCFLWWNPSCSSR